MNQTNINPKTQKALDEALSAAYYMVTGKRKNIVARILRPKGYERRVRAVDARADRVTSGTGV